MKDFKRLVILAISFFIILILFFLFENPSGNRKKAEPPLFIPEFDRDKVVEILIKSPEKGKTYLKKEDNTWDVTSDNKTFKADTENIDSLFDTVEKIRAGTVVSKNPKKFAPFEVTESKGIEVIINGVSKKNLARFFVGKSGPDILSTYVRAANAGKVILANGILRTVFEKELKEWRDKTILKLNKDDIIEYRVDGDIELHLKKDKNKTWQVLAPAVFMPKKETVNETIGKFCDLNAVDFPEGKLSEFQLDKPRRTITAFLENGEKKVLLVGKEKNAFQHYLKVQERGDVYLIEDYVLQLLSPPAGKLQEDGKKEEKDYDNSSE